MSGDEAIQVGTIILEAIVKLGTMALDIQAGKLDPSVALTAVAQLHDNLVANNATIDKLAHDKFDHSEP